MGVFLVITAYVLWAFFPLYFKQMAAVNSFDLLAFRTVFSLVSVFPFLLLCGKWKEFTRQFRSWKTIGMIFLAAVLVSFNWLIFIILVNNGYAIEASLGYYINPLFTVLLGLVFFGERFGKLQWTSLAFAVAGVTILTIGTGSPPWGALCVAISFGLYGMMKKIARTDSLTSLSVEMVLIQPIAISYIYYTDAVSSVWSVDPRMFAWLFGCGVLTSLALLIYGAGARKVKMSTLGICQFITPTGQFLTAVLIFKEPMPPARWFCFALIWIALLLFSLDSMRDEQSKSTFRGE